MASIKERQRWEMIFRRAQEMNQRQRAAINRLLLMNTECMAALYEISQMRDVGDGFTTAADRAQAAIETVERLRTSQAAADAEAEEQLKDDGGESATDEEKHNG